MYVGPTHLIENFVFSKWNSKLIFYKLCYTGLWKRKIMKIKNNLKHDLLKEPIKFNFNYEILWNMKSLCKTCNVKGFFSKKIK